MSTIDVALACDADIFLGLQTTIASIAVHERSAPLRVHLLDGGLTEEQWQAIQGQVARLNPGIQLQRHTMTLGQISDFHVDPEVGLMTYARLFLPNILKSQFILYIDSDVLVTKPLSEISRYFDETKALAAVADPCVDYREDIPMSESVDISKYTYVNAGFLVINAAKWRAENLGGKILDFLNGHSREVRHCDQSGLNWVLRDQIQLLPQEWNTFGNERDFNSGHVAPGAVNIHYSSGFKPWKRPLPRLSHRLWWSFTRRFLPRSAVPSPWRSPRNIARYLYYGLKEPEDTGAILRQWNEYWDALPIPVPMGGDAKGKAAGVVALGTAEGSSGGKPG